MVPVYGCVHAQFGLRILSEGQRTGGQLLLDGKPFGKLGFLAEQYLPVVPPSHSGLLARIKFILYSDF